MSDLRVTLIQSELHWHDAAANRAQFAEKFRGLVGTTDLVLLPEMFTTGFTMDAPRYAEPMEGSSVEWMAQQARSIGAVVAGSVIIQAGDNYYNRLIWMPPDGNVQWYDKRHLFRMADEHHHYAAGEERLVVDLLGWRICPMVCYDLRFPVWSRNRNDYDLLLYVANWPQRRSPHWRSLLMARAIENLCYVAAVNRVGSDGNAIEYSGDSTIVTPQGESLVTLANTEAVVTLTLSRDSLEHYRERFPAHLDADDFVLH